MSIVIETSWSRRVHQKDLPLGEARSAVTVSECAELAAAWGEQRPTTRETRVRPTLVRLLATFSDWIATPRIERLMIRRALGLGHLMMMDAESEPRWSFPIPPSAVLNSRSPRWAEVSAAAPVGALTIDMA